MLSSWRRFIYCFKFIVCPYNYSYWMKYLSYLVNWKEESSLFVAYNSFVFWTHGPSRWHTRLLLIRLHDSSLTIRLIISGVPLVIEIRFEVKWVAGVNSETPIHGTMDWCSGITFLWEGSFIHILITRHKNLEAPHKKGTYVFHIILDFGCGLK